jgi:glycosyltransferase involved in cell wall biosynthesis
MTTLHILSNPYGPVNLNNRSDPFSVAAVKFIKYMTSYGWDCVHYSVVGADVPCETIQCLDVITDDKDLNVSSYNLTAGQAIHRRKSSGDMIVCFHGIENRGACDLNPDLRAVEPSIGYDSTAVFAPYRAFVSYAQMHMYYGTRGMLMTPSWFDTVIYNAIDSREFDFNTDKDDYFLCFGRIISTKGIDLAIQATEATGSRLIIAGPGSLEHIGYTSIPKHVEVLGIQNAEQRRKLMSRARAVMGLTYYVEPFGNMIVEGLMSGTPAITTDWGGFTETVQEGITGFRCREFQDVVRAIENIDNIDPLSCRSWAFSNCDDTIVHPQFDRWFRKLEAHDFYRK